MCCASSFSVSGVNSHLILAIFAQPKFNLSVFSRLAARKRFSVIRSTENLLVDDLKDFPAIAYSAASFNVDILLLLVVLLT